MAKLIICIDGLGNDMATKENMPFLYNFGKENRISKLKTLFAFTGLEYSFFTGKTPEETGIWLEFCHEKSIFNNIFLKILSFNKKLRTYGAAILQYLNGRTWISGLHNIPKEKLKYFDTSVKKGLWKLDFFQQKKFAFYKWPFFVTKNGKEKRKIIFNYENDQQRINRLLAENKEIYYIQLMEIDKNAHKYGKKNPKTREILRRVDKIIEDTISRFQGEVVIWSDHGFADIKEYIDIESILPKRKDYFYFIAGTTASFWFENKEAEKEVLDKIKSLGLRFLNKENAKKYKIPYDRKYGDAVFFLKKGSYFFPNFYQKDKKEKFVAMHGYPDDNELDGIFISTEKKANKSLKITEIKEFL